jgi:hypothetical protein
MNSEIKLEDLSKESLLKILEIIKENLSSAEDAGDFCLWLSQLLHVDVTTKSR